jgi:hypothetical protein
VTDLKPETVAAIRAAFDAMRLAIVALTSDPGRNVAGEGGYLGRPEAGKAHVTLYVRPEIVQDIADQYQADMRGTP